MLKAEGIEEGCGIAARDYRHSLGREDILLVADVHDRTGYPLVNVPIEQAAGWECGGGADALILTGSNYEQSLEYLQVVRRAGVSRPLLMGGGVTTENVGQVLKHADGVIVSRAFKRKDYREDQVVRWELELVKRFMQAARQSVAV
jgi:predicted TIM-barrel enzyme